MGSPGKGRVLDHQRAERSRGATGAGGSNFTDDGFGFGNPCNAHIEAHSNCPCNDYTGDGGPCLTQTTLDTAFPPSRSCGHPPSKHLST
ncbi:DUF6422 family protein [Mesorhizobium sp. M0954]|uniref:DUF6422 family protein n=1 Tax=unclassified Mesorhizobium TaxID=325217 RepID=UPI00333DFB0C